MPQRRTIFALFFLSGFCGLVYQTVWVRLAFASFGIVTPVLSVVVSVFMLGLCAGSWLGGRWIGPLSARTKMPPVFFYALAELVIGAGSFAVPALMRWGQTLLLKTGPADSFAYLLLSGLFLAAALFPWCLAMGMTLPFMLAHLRDTAEERLNFGFLYTVNTLGALAGVLAAAVALIEAFGFRQTLLIAGVLNLCIGLLSLSLAHRVRGKPARTDESRRTATALGGRGVMAVLFTAGFAGLGMEVAWIRGFTPVLGTQVYSFALLLFVYLLATWSGAACYRRGPDVSESTVLLLLPAAACLPVILNDPSLLALLPEEWLHALRIAFAAASIFPFCALLGYLTPALVDRAFGRDPRAAGRAYAVNTAGCIAGPLAASYLLLPALGFRGTLLALALPFLLFPFMLGARRLYSAAGLLSGVLLAVAALVSRSYEEPGHGVVRRDHSATVLSLGTGMGKQLLVNGIGMTALTTDTKVMAHLPVLALGRPPARALSLCFGMGTSHRSLLSWGGQATAVELVPSVLAAFEYYFDDAAQVRANPRGTEVVDDGRRFLRRTRELYDVVVVDPPPPMESAGSSLLYSEEFYADVKSKLADGAVLQQWLPYVPGADFHILEAVTVALTRSFRHVRLFRSSGGAGYHFLASDREIVLPAPEEAARRMPEAARRDLVEWHGTRSPASLLGEVFRRETPLAVVLRDHSRATIRDDRPDNEYFLLRRVIGYLFLRSLARAGGH